MEKLADLELRNVINELTQGRELANQLQIHLHAPSSSQEVRELLVNKIVDSYDKVLSMVKYDGHLGEKESITPGGGAIGTSDSPRSLSGSPRSQDSDVEFKDHDRSDTSKKRKAMPRWTKQVQLYPTMGPEGPLDDGYSWRKYGQKEILGAKYPRGYYRCTHRHTQGCLATKQVQRSDDDPTILEITYRRRHTCNPSSSLKSASTTPPEKQESIIGGDQNVQQLVIVQPLVDQQCLDQCETECYNETLLSNFRSNLKVMTEDLGTQNQSFPNSFHSPSSSNISHENFPFPPTIMEANFPASIMPPTSVGSHYFLPSSTQVNDFQAHNFQTSEHVITDVVSATTSATNSPSIGFDYPLSTMIFGPNFTYDNPGFSS